MIQLCEANSGRVLHACNPAKPHLAICGRNRVRRVPILTRLIQDGTLRWGMSGHCWCPDCAQYQIVKELPKK